MVRAGALSAHPPEPETRHAASIHEGISAGGQHGRAQPAAGSPLPLLTQPISTLPPTIQTVLAARFAQLSPFARELANVAAVIGREFAFSVLARASGESEDTVVRGLDELWQRRLVREQGTGTAETYDFSHDKLREQVYTSLSPTYRRLLHRRVAEAFKAVYVQDQDAVSGEIAAHYERAGLPDPVPVKVRQGFQEAERILTQASDPSSPAWRHEWIELQFARVWPPMRWSADDLTAAIRKARPIVEQYGTQEQREFLVYARAT